MNCRKRMCYFCKILVNIFLLIHLIFIVICNTENGDHMETLSQSLTSSVSSDGKPGHRERRSVRRGQSNYFQKSYEMNRLRHELEDRLRAPRHKPFFHSVNEVYSYYLPPKFNKINANVENFSDKMSANYSDNRQTYGTKTRSMTRARGEERFSLSRRILPPPAGYQPITRQQIDPYGPYDREGPPPPSLSNPEYERDLYERDKYERDQQRYRTELERYKPGIISRGQPPVSSGGGIGYSRGSAPSSSSSDSSRDSYSGLIPEPQNIVRNSTFPGIPGYQRVDFPGYATVPFTGFRCSGQPYYGYYADVTAGCQVFHVCQPDGREYSFLCPNSTLFHQKVQTCDWWWHVDCPSSPRYYYLNARIGVLPPVDATLYRYPKA